MKFFWIIVGTFYHATESMRPIIKIRYKNANNKINMQRITAILLSLNIVEIMIDINKILVIESLKSRNIKVIVIIIDFIISNRVFDSIRITALLLYINVFLIG